MPHCTRSNTGLANIASIASEAGIGRLSVRYASRVYATRHGAGPLAHHERGTDWARIVDPTNVRNDWQGSIRSAPLDIEVLRAAIENDLGHVRGMDIEARLVVTCVDQIPDGAEVFNGETSATWSQESVAPSIAIGVGIPLSAVSRGPSGANVEDLGLFGA
jgi:adenylosuccinate synthase